MNDHHEPPRPRELERRRQPKTPTAGEQARERADDERDDHEEHAAGTRQPNARGRTPAAAGGQGVAVAATTGGRSPGQPGRASRAVRRAVSGAADGGPRSLVRRAFARAAVRHRSVSRSSARR